jgi:hypothetical protein
MSAAGTPANTIANVKANFVSSSSKSTNGSMKRRSFHPSKQIRIPPIPSPGLLMPPPSSLAQGIMRSNQSLKLNNAFCAPSEVFDLSMEASGYSLEKRIHEPHRGSSVKRTVDDMFDSNVILALYFPELVPEDLFSNPGNIQVKSEPVEFPNTTIKSEEQINDISTDEQVIWSSTASLSLPHQLIKVLENTNAKNFSDHSNGLTIHKKTRKRNRAKRFSDMVPVSLTLPYPEDFIQRRLSFIKAVKERECAIREWQCAKENIEISNGQSEQIELTTSNTATISSCLQGGKELSITCPASVPDIPEPPVPPTIEELENFVDTKRYKHDQHPFYLPDTKSDLVAHLDKSCFHLTEGRYFGLSSNFVADPNFVGANAPGITALTSSAGAGLATATSGTGNSSSSMAFAISSNYHSTASSSAATTSSSFKNQDNSKSSHNNVSTKSDTTKEKSHVSSSGLKSSSSKSSSSSKKSSSGAKPTASSSDLRKIMEGNVSTMESFKTAIIRAAVRASRIGKHGQAFRGPDGETYPDVGKAFSVHACIKPCQRCKSNKQGVSSLIARNCNSSFRFKILFRF